MRAESFDRLVDAYRSETAHRDRDVVALRTRVLAATRARRSLVRHHWWFVPLATTLMGSLALAATNAGAERAMSRLSAWLGPRPIRGTSRESRADESRTAGTPVRRGASERVVPAAEPVSTSILQQVVVPLAALPIDETPIVNKERVSLLRHAPADAGPPRAEQDFGAELSLYGQAHALHFGGGAAAPALDAWGRYLHEYPKGALSAEARFNEAVCLLKLGRRMEARRRLQSLVDADAAPSSARSQARELLLALGGAATVP